MSGGTPAGQQWDPELYARNARFVSELGEPLVELLAPRRGERVLDLGCGDGVLTEKLVALGCEVVAVDASAEQVAAARSRGLDSRVVDARELPFGGEFDAVFSNAVLHWIPDPDAVIQGVRRSLRPGGRFVAEMGGRGNIETIARAIEAALERRGIDPRPLNPWYFPAPDEYRRRLESCGFRVTLMEHFPRPTPLPGDIAGWMETFAGCFTAPLPEKERRRFTDEVQEELRPRIRAPDGIWMADYVRLRFRAET